LGQDNGVVPRAALIFSLIAAGLSAAEQVRPLQVRWAEALGSPASPYFAGAPPSELVESFETPDFKAQLFRQRTDKATWQRILVMKPKGLDGRTAGVVVPFYDPDRMCGYDLKSKQRLDPERNTAFFALHLVRQGYVVAAVEAYPFNLLTPEEQKASKGGMGVWRDAASKLARQEPGWTGMGRLTHDTRLAADLLASDAQVDPARLAVMGHSLGGKMAFYAGCLDPRFKAIVASDFGLAWDDSNWGDAWYFGDKLKAMRADGLSQEQLLAVTSTPFRSPADVAFLEGGLRLAGSADGHARARLRAPRPTGRGAGQGRQVGLTSFSSSRRLCRLPRRAPDRYRPAWNDARRAPRP
jgi:hypothetical protein